MRTARFSQENLSILLGHRREFGQSILTALLSVLSVCAGPAVCLTVPSALSSLPQVTSWFEHYTGPELLGGLWLRPCGRCSGWLSLLQVVM